MPKEKIYYAHSKRSYDTRREKSELRWLRKRYDVVDPNKDMGELGSREPYLQMVRTCGSVVCSEHNGHLTRGTYEEVYHALVWGYPVLCIRRKGILRGFVLLKVIGLQIVDGRDYAGKYSRVHVE